jgi:hypothetical protein
MPRKSKEGAAYPSDWAAIATAVKEGAGWCCIRCGHKHEPAAGYCLTVHHADLNPSNNAWWNLLALCQRCHLQIQHKVILERPWVLLPHSEWFKPYAAGWYAHRYLGLTLTRDEVLVRLDELLAVERQIVLGVA